MSSSKVIVLTGASRGIGLSIAHYLLKQPSKLVVVGRSKQPLQDLKQQYPDQVEVVLGDFADLSLGKKAIDAALEKWQRIDGVIANHAVLDPVQRVVNSSGEAWRSAFDINVFSIVALTQAAIPALRESKGCIVFTSSGAATSMYPTWSAYGASKAAINHFAGSVATEEKDITTVSIRPGVVDTEMQREIREKHHTVMDADDVKRFAGFKKDGGLLKPEQPGNVMARIVLDPPKHLSGKFLTWSAEELKSYQD